MPPLYPCSYESLLGDLPQNRRCSCSERSFDADSIVLPYLHDAYRGNIIVTLSEPSFSYLVRSELLFHEDGNDHQRTSLRKHIFETTKRELVFPTPNEFIKYRNVVSKQLAGVLYSEILDVLKADQDLAFEFFVAARKFDQWLTKRAAPPRSASILTLPQTAQEIRAWINDKYESRIRILPEVLPYLSDVFMHVAKTIAAMHFSSLACRSYTKDDIRDSKIAQYSGFIDLRPKMNGGFPVALGILAPPNRYNKKSDHYVIITGDYVNPFGGVPEDCGGHLLPHFYPGQDIPTCHRKVQTPAKDGFSFYIAHDNQGIANCSQACAIMITGLLSDREAKVIGSLEASAIPAMENPGTVLSKFDRSPGEIQEMLEKYCNVNTVLIGSKRQDKKEEENYIADRILDACIVARCPAILFLDERALNGRAAATPRHFVDAHAVVVAGVKQSIPFDIPSMYSRYDARIAEERPIMLHVTDSKIDRFILHDPARGPFVEHDAEKCFNACWQYDNKINLNILVATPIGITVSCSQCIDGFPDGMQKYRDPHLEGQFHIRLYSRYELIRDIFTPLADQNIFFDEPPFLDDEKKYWVFFGLGKKQVNNNIFLSFPDIFVVEAMTSEGSYPKCWYGCVRMIYVSDDAPELDFSFQEYFLDEPVKHCARYGVSSKIVQRFAAPATPLLDGTEITPSVMTSSSGLELTRLFSALSEKKINTVELFMLRNRDFLQWIDSPQAATVFPLRFPMTPAFSGSFALNDVKEKLRQGKLSAADMFTASGNADASLTTSIADWIRSQMLGTNTKISAFASYFSNIIDGTHRNDLCKKNQKAICRCLEIAFQLKYGEHGTAIIPGPVVFEMVAGSSLRVRHNNPTTVMLDSNCITNLASSIGNLIDNIQALYQDFAQDDNWVLSLEPEPGMNFAVNSEEAVSELLSRVDANSTHKAHFGLNYDIAHINACRIDAGKYADRFVNAHVSVFRGDEHYRDLPFVSRPAMGHGVAEMSPKERAILHVGIAEYQRSLKMTTLPKTNSLAIEMEGAPCFSFIKESLYTLTGV